jgi:hypothetical protein
MAGDPEIQPRDSISGELTLNYVLDDLEKVLGKCDIRLDWGSRVRSANSAESVTQRGSLTIKKR